MSDPNGRVQKRIKLNSSIANNCSIGRYGSVPYNISFDLSDTNFTSLREVRYSVEGTYRYSKCVGNGCKICNTQRIRLQSILILKIHRHRFFVRGVKGSGVCKECDGSGKTVIPAYWRRMGVSFATKLAFVQNVVVMAILISTKKYSYY